MDMYECESVEVHKVKQLKKLIGYSTKPGCLQGEAERRQRGAEALNNCRAPDPGAMSYCNQGGWMQPSPDEPTGASQCH